MLPQTEEHQHRQFGCDLKAVMSFGHHLTQCSQGPSIASEIEAVEKKDGIYQVILRHFLKFGNIQRPPKSTDPVPKWDHSGKEGGRPGGEKRHNTFLHQQNLSISQNDQQLSPLPSNLNCKTGAFPSSKPHCSTSATAEGQNGSELKIYLDAFFGNHFWFHSQTSEFRNGSTQTSYF